MSGKLRKCFRKYLKLNSSLPGVLGIMPAIAGAPDGWVHKAPIKNFNYSKWQKKFCRNFFKFK